VLTPRRSCTALLMRSCAAASTLGNARAMELLKKLKKKKKC
jgi:hypothetical protein